MILDQTSESPNAAEIVYVWNLPWQARLKNLAEARHLCLVQAPHRPGTVQSWLERVRKTS